MTELVIGWSRSQYSGLAQRASGVYERMAARAPERDVIIIGIILCILQVLDGVLTGMGTHADTSMEGNPILRFLIESWGHAPALVAVKALAIVIVVFLTTMCASVTWLKTALKVMIGIYFFAAVLPWTLILFLPKI